MFDNTLAKLYSSLDSASYIKSIYGDFQPFSKIINFDDDFQIEITKRLFCDVDTSINESSYLEIENETYKVIDIKKWDDYYEIYLYKLKRQV